MEHLEETTSRQLGYFVGFVTVQFGKKTANIKCKKLLSLQYCVRATTSHIKTAQIILLVQNDKAN